MSNSQGAALRDMIERHRIIVCAGTGGVGKTTTAAVLGVEAAHAGKKAVVVTIDPAKRLADALGLDELSNQPKRIALDGIVSGDGELWALMLDTKSTFDDLVARYADSEEQAGRIQENRFFQNISTALSGTQEYMAMEKLYELHAGGDERYPDFDVVIVDTPPTRNALDFLDAPNLLTRILENKLYRALMAPTRGVLRVVTTASHALLRQLSHIIGAEVVDDGLAFFRAFEGMEAGFKQRAQDVLALLSSDETAFILVASPRPDTVAEARYFAQQLAEGGIVVRGVVWNRLHPNAASITAKDIAKKRAGAKGDRADWWQALLDYQTLAEREATAMAELDDDLEPGTPMARVPLLADDVCDLDGLEQVRNLLFR